MKLLDANILLRLFLDDDKTQVDAVEKFFHRAFQEKQELFVSDLTVAEIVWVMEKTGSLPPKVIAPILRSALDDSRIHFENRERLLAALALYESRSVDFIDAYQASLFQEKKLESVVSFDHDFSKLPVRWENPKKS